MIFRNNIHAPVFKKRLSVEEIKSRIVDEPFELVSTEYVNAREKLEWKCFVCGNNFFSSWLNISSGWKCSKCKAIKAAARMKETVRKIYKMVTVEEFSLALTSKNIELLDSIEDFNAKTKLTFRCGFCGKIFKSQAGDVCRKWRHPGCWDCSRPRTNRGGEYAKPYPKEWTTRLKESVRNRDNRKCQFPNCQYTDDNGNPKLHVHHINGIKINCQEYNLISLCGRHHKYVEWNNPDSWQEYFYAITADYEYR